MKKFTKGPWELDSVKCRIVSESGRSIANTAVYDDRTFATDSENEANATLIAAAPDLYEALQILLRAWQGGEWSQDNYNIDPEAIAKEAISKATTK